MRKRIVRRHFDTETVAVAMRRRRRLTAPPPNNKRRTAGDVLPWITIPAQHPSSSGSNIFLTSPRFFLYTHTHSFIYIYINININKYIYINECCRERSGGGEIMLPGSWHENLWHWLTWTVSNNINNNETKRKKSWSNHKQKVVGMTQSAAGGVHKYANEPPESQY